MAVPAKLPGSSEVTLVKLAREIAMDIHELDTILKANDISKTEWARISKHPQFIEYLQSEISAWQSAVNTEQRVKLKSAALIEMWLEEANARLHDAKENLAPKTELAKFLGRLAGIGVSNTSVSGDVGERVNITINLGADHAVSVTKTVTPRVIEHEPTQGVSNGDQ